MVKRARNKLAGSYVIGVCISFMVLTFSASGYSLTVDKFKCSLDIFSEAKGSLIHSTELITSNVRSYFPYKRFRGYNVRVESSEQRFKIQNPNFHVKAKIIYRFASNIGGVGRATDAALWTCSQLEVISGSSSQVLGCETANDQQNPFKSEESGWTYTSLLRNKPAIPTGHNNKLSMEHDDHKISLTCDFLETK